MAISRINIEQQRAVIGIENQPPKVTIHSQRPEMNINTVRPEMQIEREAPTFELNWNKLWSDMGTPRPADFANKIRNAANTDMLKSVRESVKDGNYVGDTKIDGLRLAEIAKKRSQKAAPPANIGLVPKASPSVKWTRGDFQISWSDHEVVIEWEGEYMPMIQVEPGSIEIYMKEEPYISISIEDIENYIPRLVGRKVDREA